MLACALAGCAVGPDFKPPPAPEGPGFIPAGQLPEHTASAPMPGGDAQQFVDGMDIPGQWWTLFQSAELNRSDRARPEEQSDPAGRTSLFAPGERESGGPARNALSERLRELPGAARQEFGGGIRPAAAGLGISVHIEQRLGERVVHARRLRRRAPPDRGRAGASRLCAIRARGQLPDASPPMWSPPRSPRHRCARRSPPPRTSRARSKRSSTSRSGASPRAAHRAPTYCSSRRPCKRLSRACRRCAPRSPSSAICSRPTWARCPPTTRARSFIWIR